MRSNTRTSRYRIDSIILFTLLILGSTQSAAQSEHRVVSVGGALTEIVFALGLQGHLVGVDTTSQYPDAALSMPKVGYQRALSAEGILSLKPTIVLATADAGPPEVLQQIAQAGVEIEIFQRDYTIVGLVERINAIGTLFNQEEEAVKLSSGIVSRFHDFNQFVRQPDTVDAVFLLGAVAGSAMAAGRQTSAHAMFNYAGVNNAMSAYNGYKPVSAEAMIKASPDVLIVVSHGDDNGEDIINSALALPGVGLTPAGRDGRVLVVDALRFLGFGPRTVDALQDLNTWIMPVN